MLGESKNQFSLTRAALSTGERAKSNQSISYQFNIFLINDRAIVVHHTVLRPSRHAALGTFPALAGHEVLYTTGNHAVGREEIPVLLDRFEMVLGPSEHVMRPYYWAGLDRRRGAVIPHGIDPAVFSPDGASFSYPTRKGFKFLQTSFPWLYEKGFDLTIRAFGRAFSSRDDAALVLRVPVISDPDRRRESLDRLQELISAEVCRPGAPEIMLLEEDVEPRRRGDLYRGADCYVHPLRAEGFGMTILEAMACGLPVIATPWSGPADFLSARWAYALHHSNPVAERSREGHARRYHVEPEFDDLVHLMRQAYERRDEATALGRAAARIARENWTWTHAARRLAAALGLDAAAEARTIQGSQDL